MPADLDFIGIPSRDADASLRFYTEVLELQTDDDATYEVWIGTTCFAIWEPEKQGRPFAPQKNAHPAIHCRDVAGRREELEARGVVFQGPTIDTGVCHMALFTDPDGNDLMLHHRYAPR